MPNISVTYTFANSTTADATQVNQNFTDIINGTSDGTKDLSIAALTVAGNFTANGSTNTLGNASSDDLVITASLASSIPIKTTNSYDIGSSTIGLRSIYLADAGSAARSTRILGATVASSWTMTLPTGAGTSGYVLSTNGSGVTSWVDRRVVPTVQKFTSGSGTYTTAANATYIRVRMVGGGGGGGGSGSSGGTGGGTGGNSTFGSSLLQADGGTGGGATGGNAGTGGAASLGSGPVGLALSGSDGGAGSTLGAYNSGDGGASAFGGGGGSAVASAGLDGKTNSGGGGGGGGGNTGVGAGGGGGAGGFVDAIITSPSASYSYAVGAAGSAGSAGTSGFNGGAGGSGIIIVEEYYQ